MADLCPRLQTIGSCKQRGCQHSHDLNRFCFTCNTFMIDRNHVSSQSHYDAEDFQRLEPVCSVCGVVVAEANWREHRSGKAHTRRKNESRSRVEKIVWERLRPPGKAASCDVCCIDFVGTSGLASHVTSKTHRKMVSRYRVGQLLRGLKEMGRHVTVSPADGVDFGSVRWTKGQTGHRQVSVEVKRDDICLLSISILTSDALAVSPEPFTAHHNLTPDPIKLLADEPMNITILAESTETRGPISRILELTFETDDQDCTFIIRRELKIELQPSPSPASRAPATSQAAARVHPGPSPAANGLSREPRRTKGRPATSSMPVLPLPRSQPVEHISPGTGPVLPRETFVEAPASRAFSTVPYQTKLNPYPFDQSFEIQGTRAQQLAVIKGQLPTDLRLDTYAKFFTTLLQAEEAQVKKDLEVYELNGVRLDKHRNLYYLDVPGLAEKRPSVLMGDIVKLRRQAVPHKWFGGRVIDVRDVDIGISISPNFKYQAGEPCDVRFTVNRMIFRRMHQAASLYCAETRHILLPNKQPVQYLQRPSRTDVTSIKGELFDARVATNPPQLRAIAAILNRPEGSVPFVIFGPPGTGKTVTMVESIRQVLAKDPTSRILACAPSNSAADIIAERLVSLGPQQLFRLNAPSRKMSTLPEVLKPFSFVDSTGLFSVVSKEAMEGYRVVVSTCMSASVPCGIGMKVGHFSHIFIDEAGQCSEPELMVSIKTMANNETRVILSGDPKQLGPIIRSPIAAELGLQTSYLDRLTEDLLYDVTEGDGTTIVKLLKNFRSHEAILRFSNENFYGNELQICGPSVVIDSLAHSPELVTPGFPVIFHGTDSPDQRDHRSPSYFNDGEVSIVAEVVERLLTDDDRILEASQIGIIAPYNAQVIRLRERINRFYRDLKIGSTELFQGQEREVILISTVRSDESKIGHDLRHVLGFLVNPRRLNVALTRAKALLVIVGNPHVLGLDPLWQKLLTFIYKSGGWKGVPPNWDPDRLDEGGDWNRSGAAQTARQSMDALTQQLHAAMVRQNFPREWIVDDRDFEESTREAEVERPWRVEE